jgi:hypothetical protein
MKKSLLYFLGCVLCLLITKPVLAQVGNQNSNAITAAVIFDSKWPNVDETPIADDAAYSLSTFTGERAAATITGNAPSLPLTHVSNIGTTGTRDNFNQPPVSSPMIGLAKTITGNTLSNTGIYTPILLRCKITVTLILTIFR